MMLNAKQKKDLTKRLKYAIGQMQAIESMIQADRSAQEIYVQLRSVSSAFEKSILTAFEDEHRKALAEIVVRQQDECPGNCAYCDSIDIIKRDFPDLTITQVLDLLHKLQTTENENDA